MGELSDGIIQIILGKEAKNRYTSFWGSTADKLIADIGLLRQSLFREGIVLPICGIFVDDEMNSQEFVIRVGILKTIGDCRNTSVISELDAIIHRYFSEKQSVEEVYQRFRNANEKVRHHDYQGAIIDYTKVFYFAAFYPETYSMMVNAAINTAGIEYQSQAYGEAFEDAEIAYILANAKGVYDVSLKYHASCWKAITSFRCGDLSAALQYQEKAVSLIMGTENPYEQISALNLMVQLYAKADKYYDIAKGIGCILKIINDNKNIEVTADDLYTIQEVRACAYEATIHKLAEQYVTLYSRYQEIAMSFQTRLINSAFHIIDQYGGVILAGVVGELAAPPIASCKVNVEKNSGSIIIANEITKIKTY